MPPNYDKMLVRELKAELEKRKIPVFGTRRSLVQKLKRDDRVGYGMLTVPELKIRMTAEGILDVSGDKSTLKSRMRAKLISRGYEFLPVNDLRQLCRERGLNLPKKNSTGQKTNLIGKLVNADTQAFSVDNFQKSSKNSSYSNISSGNTYSHGPSQDGSPVVMTIIGSVIAIALVMGCIGLMDTEEEDDYYSSSGGSSSTYTSTPCEELRDVWCYSYSLDMCIYHDSSSGVLYYQEAKWYGC